MIRKWFKRDSAQETYDQRHRQNSPGTFVASLAILYCGEVIIKFCITAVILSMANLFIAGKCC